MRSTRDRATAYIEVNGREFRLAPGRDLVEVMSQIESITRSEPAFVDLSEGDHLVSVLVSPGAHVIVTVRADGQSAHPGATGDSLPFELPFRDWEW